MTTINITVPTGKRGEVAVFTIEFNIENFDEVINAASEIKTVEQVYTSKIWTVK